MLMSPLTKMISMAITGVCLLGIFAVGPAAAATNTAAAINTAAATHFVSATKAVAEVDTQLQPYSKVSGISGNLSSVGSDTLANLMTYWTEAFKRQYPNVNIQIQTSGSSTAPTALVEATAQLGPMSREMKTKEIEAFEKEYGYKPTAIKVAVDALAVFVHEDNPLKGINFEQLDAIYSRTLRCGALVPITQWGQLGLPNSWQQRDIQLFGRNSVSGTYGDFKKRALCRGDFRNNVNEQPGSASVVQAVSTSLNAIGYSGIGYKTTGIRAIPVAREGSDYVEATVENSINGNYPLSRYLYLYINKHPNKALAPMEQEFLRFILSSDGQNIVQKDGYIPLPVAIVNENMVKLGLKD